MKHHATRTWCDNLPKAKINEANKLMRTMRNPRIFEKLESNKAGRKILPFYTFVAYDLQDLGALYFIKLNFNKMKAKMKKNQT